MKNYVNDHNASNDRVTASTRRSGRRRSLQVAALAAVASVGLSGCFLRSFVANVNSAGNASVSVDVEASFCGAVDGPYNCGYQIYEAGGLGLRQWTSSFELLQEFGVLGLIIDPLVVQVPADVANVVATYNNAGVDLPLVVTETTAFPVTPTQTVTAEPGTKFIIAELPTAEIAALPPNGADFNFSLDFDVTDPSDLFIKPMLTGRVDFAGTAYYLPLLPCVTDFAQVPVVQIPVGPVFQDLLPQAQAIAAEDLGCDQVVYDFTADVTQSPTTTTTIAATSTSIAATTTTIAAATSMPSAATTPAGPTTVTPPDTTDIVLPATGLDTFTQAAVAVVLSVLGLAAIASARRRPGSGGTQIS